MNRIGWKGMRGRKGKEVALSAHCLRESEKNCHLGVLLKSPVYPQMYIPSGHSAQADI
jgi:hypothetical protein